MGVKDNIDDNDQKNEKKEKDLWDKIRAAGGIATAVAVTAIGTSGSCMMQKKQEDSNRMQLYTQLMSQRENSESAVRTDMFQQILSSFLKEEPGTSCTLDLIDESLLRLELLSRNFHEMLDMEPLFRHVLLDIVRDIPSLPEPNEIFAEKAEITSDDNKDRGNTTCQDKIFQSWKREEKNKKTKIKWDDWKTSLKEKKLEQLIKIARRITRKQMESLNGDQSKLSFTIDLKDTCDDIKPNEPIDDKKCKKSTKNIWTNSIKLKNVKERVFTVSVNRSYQKWQQVRVVVETMTKEEYEYNGNAPEDKKVTPNRAEFWLTYFDFPLAENTFLSSKERYSVILEKINKRTNEAVISLLYYPATYAGMKEKSFYQQKLISTLLEKDSTKE